MENQEEDNNPQLLEQQPFPQPQLQQRQQFDTL